MTEIAPNRLDMLREAPRITVIGGGTGSFTVLSGLTEMIGENLSAVVSTTDDGGNTGDLRRIYNFHGLGDARQCLIAMSRASEVKRMVWASRFDEGLPVEQDAEKELSLKGYNTGNVILLRMQQLAEKQGKGLKEIMEMASDYFEVAGKVLPMSDARSRLLVTQPNGEVIYGEHNLDYTTVPNLEGSTISFDKPTQLTDEAYDAIAAAHTIVYAPGDVYGSVGPNLAAEGTKDAIDEARARGAIGVLVCNLMNRPAQTVGWDASTYVRETNRLARTRAVDFIIHNTGRPSNAILEHYATVDNVFPVEADITDLSSMGVGYIGRNIFDAREVEVDPNDPGASTRSALRHDSAAVAACIMTAHFGNGIRYGQHN